MKKNIQKLKKKLTNTPELSYHIKSVQFILDTMQVTVILEQCLVK